MLISLSLILSWCKPVYCVGYIGAQFLTEEMAGPEVRGREELSGHTAASPGDEALLGQFPTRERGVPESLSGEGDVIHRILQGKNNIRGLSIEQREAALKP